MFIFGKGSNAGIDNKTAIHQQCTQGGTVIRNGWPRRDDLRDNAQKDPMLGPIEIMGGRRDSPHFEPCPVYKLAAGILGYPGIKHRYPD